MPEKESTTLSRTASLEGLSRIDLAPMSTVDHGLVMSVEGRTTGGVFVKKDQTEHMGTTYVHSDEAREALEQDGLTSEEVRHAIDVAQAGTSLRVEGLAGHYGHDRKVTVQSEGENIGGGGKFLGKEGIVELPNGSYIDLRLVQDALLAPAIIEPESGPASSIDRANLIQRSSAEVRRNPRILRGIAAIAALALVISMSSSTSASQQSDQDDQPVAAAPAYGEHTDSAPTSVDQEQDEPSVEEAPQETASWVVESGGGIISELEDELGMSYEEAEASWIAIQPALKQAIAEGKIRADFFYEQNGNLRIMNAGPVPRDVQTVIEGLLGL